MDDYRFHTVDVLAFDLHTVVQPLADSSSLRADCRFLCDPDSYRNQYQNGQSVRTGSFEILPFARKVFEDNNFWKFYTTIRHAPNQSGPDYWKLQVPFACKLFNTTIGLMPPDNIQAKLRPQIFLSALGWSTTINIRLKGDISISQLTEFIGKLRGRETAGDSRIFDLNGHREPIWKIFGAVQEKLFEGVYSAENKPRDSRILDRYIIISPSRFSGPIKFFKRRSTAYPEMSDEERAAMLSILYGEPLDINRFNQDNEQQKFALVGFHEDGPEFALNQFDKGTFLFMQEAAKIGTKHPRAARRLECFAYNVRTTVQTAMMLCHARSDEAKRYARNDPQIGSLLSDLKINLTELKNCYQHDFCKFFFSQYGPLREYL